MGYGGASGGEVSMSKCCHMDRLKLRHNGLYTQHANETAAVNKERVAVWACVWRPLRRGIQDHNMVG